MSVLFRGTELAAIEPPDGVTGFGAAEVAYLLARHDTAEMGKSQALLRAGESDEMDEFARACGASSLLARGLAAVRDDQIETLGAAALLEYAALRTDQWTVLKRTDGAHDGVIVFHTPETLVVTQPRSFGTWFVSYSDDIRQPADLVVLLLDELAGLEAASEFDLATSRLGGPGQHVAIRRGTSAAGWSMAGPVPEESDARVEAFEDVDADTLKRRITELLALAPAPAPVQRPMPPRDPDEQARIASKFQDRLG